MFCRCRSCNALKWPYQNAESPDVKENPHANHGCACDRHVSGAQFRHAQDRNGGRQLRPRGRHVERPRTGRRELSVRSCVALPDRPRRAPDRRYLAVSLPRRLLAARPGNHDRDRGGRYRTVGPQGQGGRPAALPAARRRLPQRGARVRHANGETVEETIAEAQRYVGLGYTAIRLQSGVPGLASTYGVSRDKMFYEPADGALPVENRWSTRKYLASTPALFEAARAALGWNIDLLHDTHHRLTPIEAARLGRDLEPYRLFWLEDTVAADNQASFRLIRQHTTTPLAVGEVFNSIWDCKQLIEEQLIDYIRTTVLHAGGISHLRRIAALAELYHVKTGCHGATDLSPVCMAAALHFDLAIPNFGLQEYMRHAPQTDAVFPHAYRFHEGFLHPGDEPGLGVDINETLAAQYPYQRAYLPVNRLEDGTMTNW